MRGSDLEKLFNEGGLFSQEFIIGLNAYVKSVLTHFYSIRDEDAVQNCFIYVFEKLKLFDIAQARLSTFIFNIIRNYRSAFFSKAASTKQFRETIKSESEIKTYFKVETGFDLMHSLYIIFKRYFKTPQPINQDDFIDFINPRPVLKAFLFWILKENTYRNFREIPDAKIKIGVDGEFLIFPLSRDFIMAFFVTELVRVDNESILISTLMDNFVKLPFVLYTNSSARFYFPSVELQSKLYGLIFHIEDALSKGTLKKESVPIDNTRKLNTVVDRFFEMVQPCHQVFKFPISTKGSFNNVSIEESIL